MALMIGGTAPAFAQYYTNYKPNDKPAVEVDMDIIGGEAAAPMAPGYVAPVANEELSAIGPAPTPTGARIVSQPPAASTPPITRVLKPSGTPPAGQPEETTQEEAEQYRPYLTTPAQQAVRSYPPAPTPKTVDRVAPVTTPQPVRSYPPGATPQLAEEMPAAPLQQPVHKPAVAKKYEPSPSVVDDASYKPDYSGYYKSGAPVPAAVANVEQQPAPQKEIAAQPAAAEELTAQLPEPQSKPQLDPLPEITTERSIEQTPPPVARMAPIMSEQKPPAKIISYPNSTVGTRPLPTPQRKPVAQPEPVVATAPAKRPSLEILDTPPPPRPAAETTERIVPPVREEAKTDISALAAQVDQAAADMGTAPEPVEPPKFATVPTQSDLMLEFPGNSSDLTTATQRKLDAIVVQMEDLDDGGRLQVRGYAAGEDGSKSSARRIALSRALSVRSYLMDKGVKAKRVDVRAMGSETDRNPLDRVDLIFQR
ncbi:MAG: OmpA family protein [Alphaproteobacteria bacterium]